MRYIFKDRHCACACRSPRTQRCHSTDNTAMVWDQTRGGMKGEAPGDQTVTSHKALFTKDTHIHSPLPPTSPFTKARPSQSARAWTWETALILPPGLLAENTSREGREREGGKKTETERERKWGLNGTVCKTHLNWRLFCNVLFFLGICEGEGQEGEEVRLFPKVLNSRINHRGETQ